MEKNCSICKKTFSATGKGRNKKYCSKACIRKAANISSTAWRKRNLNQNVIVKKECVQCSKKFETIFVNKKKFCSDKCRQKFNQSTERAKLEDRKKYALNKVLYKKRSKLRYTSNKEEILEKQKLLKSTHIHKEILRKHRYTTAFAVNMKT